MPILAVPDYCSDVERPRWVVVFETGSTACFDGASCNRRARADPNATMPPSDPTAFPSGVLLPYAEANPNLYKASAVFVPYCSSDLWAGNATLQSSSGSEQWSFRGRAIAKAVLEDIREGGLPGGGALGDVAAITIVAGAGLFADESAAAGGMAQAFGGLQTLREWATAGEPAPKHANTSFTAVCDGCLLSSWGRPQLNSSAAPCLTGSDCRADTLAERGTSVWQHQHPQLAVALSPSSILRAIGTSGVPTLIQAQQLDEQQFRGLGAWPQPTGAGTAEQGAWARFASDQAAWVRSLLAGSNATSFAFSAACASPSATLTTPAFLRTAVPHQVEPGSPVVQDPMRTALPSFLSAVEAGGGGAEAFGVYRDNCTTPLDVFCNPSGCEGGTDG